MKRIWFDIEIGTNPDVSTALLFALLHPEIEVVGISLSGSKKTQPSRHGEALEVLKYINKNTIPIFNDCLIKIEIQRIQLAKKKTKKRG